MLKKYKKPELQAHGKLKDITQEGGPVPGKLPDGKDMDGGFS